jgi:polyvinyl alcohol dehydrogenase (cytochrome)
MMRTLFALLALTAAAADGRITWEYDTAREYEAVNRILAKGGQISGPGPVVAGGMVFITSGYSAIRGNAGNVLAFEAIDAPGR